MRTFHRARPASIHLISKRDNYGPLTSVIFKITNLVFPSVQCIQLERDPLPYRYPTSFQRSAAIRQLRRKMFLNSLFLYR